MWKLLSFSNFHFVHQIMSTTIITPEKRLFSYRLLYIVHVPGIYIIHFVYFWMLMALKSHASIEWNCLEISRVWHIEYIRYIPASFSIVRKFWNIHVCCLCGAELFFVLFVSLWKVKIQCTIYTRYQLSIIAYETLWYETQKSWACNMQF